MTQHDCDVPLSVLALRTKANKNRFHIIWSDNMLFNIKKNVDMNSFSFRVSFCLFITTMTKQPMKHWEWWPNKLHTKHKKQPTHDFDTSNSLKETFIPGESTRNILLESLSPISAWHFCPFVNLNKVVSTHKLSLNLKALCSKEVTRCVFPLKYCKS